MNRSEVDPSTATAVVLTGELDTAIVTPTRRKGSTGSIVGVRVRVCVPFGTEV